MKEAADKARSMRANNPSGMWPTPKTIDGIVRHSEKWMHKKWNEGGDVDLTIAVKMRMWPTSTANEMRTMDRDQLIKRREEAKPNAKNGNGFGLTLGNAMTMEGENGGQLNPTWVEWLMGWPLEWTDLKPRGTVKFQRWCALHGIPSTKG